MHIKLGFTLIELSIVIVIIGLIVAAVVAGQEMVKQVKLRQVITDVGAYKIAINTFKLQYNGMPGDITNATNFFSGTANGDGNGIIGDRFQTYSATHEEFYKAWQQMSLAEVINGSFDGSSNSGTVTVGVHVPASSLSNGGFNFLGLNTFLKNALLLGSPYLAENVHGPILSGGDTATIDEKMDDGMPDTGIVYGWRAQGLGAGTCNTDPATPREYVFTETSETCKIGFQID